MASRVSSDKDLQAALRRRAKKLWRRLSNARAQVLEDAGADAIHDLRVATRRLQTLIDVSARCGPSASGAKLRKREKRLRHSLGARRDLDVMREKLRRRIRDSASARRRQLLRSTMRQLAPEARVQSDRMRREIKKIGSRKLHRLVRRALMSANVKRLSLGNLAEAIEQAERKWIATLTDAAAREDSAGYHDVRIKAKTLRYTIELAARFIEIPNADVIVEWLKGIQDELGDWHDEVEECRRVTEILSRAADTQSDPAATALIQMLRGRTEAHTRYVRDRLRTLQAAISKRQDPSLFVNGRRNHPAPALEIVAL